MLPKKNRVTRALFKESSKRTVLRTSFFDVSYTPSSEEVKVGCVISKKRVKRAVDRNIIRRKVYQAFKESGFSKPYILIFYPRAEMLHTPISTLSLQLSQILATLQ